MSFFTTHLSKDILTDVMLSFCDSLAKMEVVKRLSDDDLLNELKELDNRRSNVPEVMEELDCVLDVIRDPEFLGSNASKLAKVATVSKTTHVIDLTDD